MGDEGTATFLRGGARLRTVRFRVLCEWAAQHYALPSWDGRTIDTVAGGFSATPPYSGAEWLEAVLLTESSGIENARRYERHLDRNGISWNPEPDTPGVDDGKTEDDASYGLMQVMGWNVAAALFGEVKPQYGPRVNYSLLYNPLIGMGFGMRILRTELIHANDDVTLALARYNGGPRWAQRLETGRVRGHEYVAHVWKRSALVREDRGR